MQRVALLSCNRSIPLSAMCRRTSCWPSQTAATSSSRRCPPAATSAPGLGSPLSPLAPGLGTAPATTAPGLGPATYVCTGTGLTPATSAPGLGSPLPHPHKDWGSPLSHLHRDWARPCHICTGTGPHRGPRLQVLLGLLLIFLFAVYGEPQHCARVTQSVCANAIAVCVRECVSAYVCLTVSACACVRVCVRASVLASVRACE